MQRGWLPLLASGLLLGSGVILFADEPPQAKEAKQDEVTKAKPTPAKPPPAQPTPPGQPQDPKLPNLKDPDCVGSCGAVSDEHPDLPHAEFDRLLAAFAKEPLEPGSEALETLLFHHTQAKKLLERRGAGPLDAKRKAFLERELNKSSAWVQVRVTDEEGIERVRLPATRVPLGVKEHIQTRTRDLQPVEYSGTIKRVGVKHLWARL